MTIAGLVYNAAAIALCYYFTVSVIQLIGNVRRSWQSGLPTVIQPTHTMNPFFLLSLSFSQAVISRLPFGLDRWKYLHFFLPDWTFRTREDSQYAYYGDVLILASPGGRVCYVGDADVATQILARRQDFPKDISFYEWVRFYGESVLTTEGNTWRHHRKVTSPPFSEAIHPAVWHETLEQSVALLQAWEAAETRLSESPTKPAGLDIIADTKSIARNVISKAGFGVTLSMSSSNLPPHSSQLDPEDSPTADHFSSAVVPEGHAFSYSVALDWVLDHALTVALVPKRVLQLGPASWKKTALAYDDVGSYLRELLQREKHRPVDNSSRSGRKSNNVLRQLLQSSAAAAAEKDGGNAGLSEDDLVGNVFVFAVAGLETTAGTLQYALALLALHQDQQEWLHKEVAAALAGESEDPREWDYESVFPKLASCLCVINETLRRYSAFLCLPKWTADKAQPIMYKGKTHVIPEKTAVLVDLHALHSKPAYWGDDVHRFRPQLWDARIPSCNSGWVRTDPTTGEKTPLSDQRAGSGKAPFCHLREPRKGAFLPFSEGFRTCLGKNFALVEMCAFLAAVFRFHRVEIAARKGESEEDARRRAQDVLDNSTSLLTLLMRREFGIRLFRRGP